MSNDEVNKTIYNLYHYKQEIEDHPEMTYIFFSNKDTDYEIEEIPFSSIMRYWDNYKDSIYTIDNDFENILEYAEKIMVKDLKNYTEDLTDNYDMSLGLVITLSYFNSMNKPSLIEYVYKHNTKYVYAKRITYVEGNI